MKIEVTQEDIDQGIPGSLYACPVAKAARRRFADTIRLSVTPSDIIVLYIEKKFFGLVQNYELKKGELPKQAKRFIKNFDIGGPNDPYVKPFSFELELKEI